MFKLHYKFPEEDTRFSAEDRHRIETELAPPFWEPLYEELVCDNPDHAGFENEVLIFCDLQNPSSRILKVCCAEFEQKIRDWGATHVLPGD